MPVSGGGGVSVAGTGVSVGGGVSVGAAISVGDSVGAGEGDAAPSYRGPARGVAARAKGMSNPAMNAARAGRARDRRWVMVEPPGPVGCLYYS